MATFLTGNKLNAELESIFEKANQEIILISPYIKLHDRYTSVFKAKRDNPELKIIVVFGKNEDDISRSMQIEDLRFFMDCPNIEIRYEKRLHAKYYANESAAIITSMNLYRFSQDNNIEAGILMNSFLGSLDLEASEYFKRVISQSELIYKKTPEYNSSLMGLKRTYKDSTEVVNRVNEFFAKIRHENFSPEKGNIKKHLVENTETKGFCIRTGKSISFNPNQPFCEEAYNSWLKFKNKDYPEKYCHYSGEPSNGETTFSKPILKKNWQKAKETNKI